MCVHVFLSVTYTRASNWLVGLSVRGLLIENSRDSSSVAEFSQLSENHLANSYNCQTFTF